MADACTEGHNIAEERLRAEAEISQEVETDQPEKPSETAEEEDKGPEVIIISKTEEAPEETETDETNVEEQ
jgi:small subunit ribosomal protein S2